MILIAESGSTKTAWRLINDNEVLVYESAGINPVHSTTIEIKNQISALEFMKYSMDISELFFYGAGVATAANKKSMQHIFKSMFHNLIKVEVDSDLMAAARALFGDGEGLVCILGTGSNTGYINNGVWLEKIPALGYILGDEGSGAHLGIQFVNSFLKRDLSEELTHLLSEESVLQMDSILENVYKGKLPNKYLASLAKLIKKYEEYPEVKKIIIDCFTLFVNKNIRKYANHKELKIGFVGSVAFYFKEYLTQVFKESELNLYQIIQNPIDELVTYYKNRL